MKVLLQFLQANEIWLYVLTGGIFLLHLRRVLAAWADWHKVLFGMEREAAQRRFSSALAVMLLSGLLGLTVFLLNSFMTPNLASFQPLATPTIDFNAKPTATLAVSQAQTTPTRVGVPTLAVVIIEGCLAGQIEWTFPTAGQEISGVVELKGTVNVPNLGFYKFEFSQPGNENWTTIAAGNQPVTDGKLGGAWDTTQLTPGDYRLRLVVADYQNTLFPACVIPIRVIPVVKE
jgi:hypothetical protein